MAFKRAEWHSGLTYQQTCGNCSTVVTYKDDVLDFRPWYADGFVYCPRCHSPLRHRETFAIDGAAPHTATPVANPAQGELAAFCPQCGKRFNDGDLFCSGCGTKR